MFARIVALVRVLLRGGHAHVLGIHPTARQNNIHCKNCLLYVHQTARVTTFTEQNVCFISTKYPRNRNNMHGTSSLLYLTKQPRKVDSDFSKQQKGFRFKNMLIKH